MKREELIKTVIEETIEQVRSKGWDLLDEYDLNRDNAIQIVYDEIKDNIY